MLVGKVPQRDNEGGIDCVNSAVKVAYIPWLGNTPWKTFQVAVENPVGSEKDEQEDIDVDPERRE